MGGLGVSIFQQIYGCLAADGLGPNFGYFDEFSPYPGLLRPSAQVSKKFGSSFVKSVAGMPYWAAKPTPQLETKTKPFEFNDVVAAKWLRSLRRKACHVMDKDEFQDPGYGSDGPHSKWIMRVLGNFQHAAFYVRYRDYIKNCVLRDADDLKRTFYHPIVSTLVQSKWVPDRDPSIELSVEQQPAPCELCVYMRLGDKSDAGK